MGRIVYERRSRGIVQIEMKEEIRRFAEYLEAEKHASENTRVSYQRDLMQMAAFLEGMGIRELSRVTRTALNSYVLMLEKEGKAASTVSRNLASMKAFFGYEFKRGRIRKDPSESIHAPRIEKKAPVILTVEEVDRLLAQPSGDSAKEIRDKAMLELLYATGMRVSELISLRMEDVNLRFGWILCRDEGRERMIPFGEKAGKALLVYLERGRDAFLKKDTETLFLNCSGAPMSRQGFWKVLKGYAARAGIEKDITPRMFRHSCAAHMAAGGARMHMIQELLGYSDLTAAQIYAGFQPEVKNEYSKVHPRG